MALNVNKRRSSAVSGKKRDTASTVAGSSGVRGKVVGEVLSGGRNTHASRSVLRRNARPADSSVWSTLSSQTSSSKVAKYTDNYEAGYSEFEEYFVSSPHKSASSSSASDSLRRRQDAEQLTPGVALVKIFGIASPCLMGIFVLGLAYYLLAEIIVKIPMLTSAPVPILLAVLLGAYAGSNAKRNLIAGNVNIPVAAAGIVLGVAAVAGVLYLYVTFIFGLIPSNVFLHDSSLATVELAEFIDKIIFDLFYMLGLAVYFVVPLVGVALGAVFGGRG